jgi:hypothetical protein
VTLSAKRLALFGAACLAACSKGPTSIAASSYDRSCATVADCAAVYEGPVSCCGTGVGCDNTAISQRALAAYSSGVASAMQNACGGNSVCNGGGPSPGGSPSPCGTGRIACTNGLCELDTPPADGATE